MKKILIASDHAGYEMKEFLKKNSERLGVQFEDLGPDSCDAVDYPDYADKLCPRLIS